MRRRHFIRNASLSGIGAVTFGPATGFAADLKSVQTPDPGPVAIGTWRFPNASKKAGELLSQGASALDAAEKGVMVEEADIRNSTVGKGGAPDREGNVTLDACIMNSSGDAGSVLCLQNHTHAVSVARRVMEETPHVILAGEGADEFARAHGFEPENLLTPAAEKAYEQWLQEKKYQPIINIENHDTIGMLCLDREGNLAGACTTSGLAYKMKGRVGDSGIIGAGLYIDNEVGGAVATGLGEAVLKALGSFLIVEMMRQGKSPQEACRIAVERIIRQNPDHKDFQVAFLALSKQGEVGAYSIHKGFSYMQFRNNDNQNIKSNSYLHQ